MSAISSLFTDPENNYHQQVANDLQRYVTEGSLTPEQGQNLLQNTINRTLQSKFLNSDHSENTQLASKGDLPNNDETRQGKPGESPAAYQFMQELANRQQNVQYYQQQLRQREVENERLQNYYQKQAEQTKRTNTPAAADLGRAAGNASAIENIMGGDSYNLGKSFFPAHTEKPYSATYENARSSAEGWGVGTKAIIDRAQEQLDNLRQNTQDSIDRENKNFDYYRQKRGYGY